MVFNFLKKYFKFKRKKNFSKLKASIDSVSPSRIIGWCFSEKIELSEIRLLVNGKVITSASIDKERPDVVKEYNISGKHGFTIIMPPNKEVTSIDDNYKLLAISKKKGVEFDLNSLKGVKDKLITIKNIFKSKISGSDGSFDGISDDSFLFGWAYNNFIDKPISVWLNCDGEIVKEILCDNWREGLNLKGVKSRKCGFIFGIDKIDEKFLGKEVWFSFDSEGLYPLSQKQRIFLPQNNKALSLINSKSSNIVESNNEINYLENIKKTNPGLKEHWNSLEDFRSYLNELEKEIDKHDRVLKFTKLKKIRKFNPFNVFTYLLGKSSGN